MKVASYKKRRAVAEDLSEINVPVGKRALNRAKDHWDLMDKLLGVDRDEEFTVYLAPVGKV